MSHACGRSNASQESMHLRRAGLVEKRKACTLFVGMFVVVVVVLPSSIPDSSCFRPPFCRAAGGELDGLAGRLHRSEVGPKGKV